MFENVQKDLERGLLANHGNLLRNQRGRLSLKASIAPLMHPGTQAVLIYRFGHWAWKLRIPVVRHLLLAVYHPLRYAIRALTGVSIPTTTEIGPGLVVHTWGGVFLPPCRIGRNASFQHGVFIHSSCREIGDDAYFGPGCKVAASVRIGHRTRIGANSVVTADVPDDCTVAGIPARVVWSAKWKWHACSDSRTRHNASVIRSS